MSVRALTAAFDSDYGTQTAARRLVLLALADAANDDGVTWISQQKLAVKAGVSEQTVRAALRDLEIQGIVQTRKTVSSRTRRNVYRYDFIGAQEPDYEALPFELEEPFPTTATEARSDDRNSVAVGTATEARPSQGLAISSSLDHQRTQDPPIVPPRNRPARVNGAVVTDDEYELAAAIITEFNRQAGTAYTAKDWIIKIIGRIREHPLLPIEAHAIVIQRALAAPWWTGAVSPSVIYGSTGQFERSVHDIRVPPKERGLTPEEIEQAGRGRIVEREIEHHEVIAAEVDEQLGYVPIEPELGEDWGG